MKSLNKNYLITLPLEVKQKIEEDAKRKAKLLLSSNSLLGEWAILYKKSESEKYFLIERHKLNQKELVDSYEEKIKEKDRIINNLIKK